MHDTQLLNWIVQGGSFGLIVAIVVFLGKVMFPRAVKLLEDQGVRFEAIVERMQARYDAQLASRDATCRELAAAVAKLADDVGRLCDRIERLEDRTDEHRPLSPEQVRRRQS